MDKSVWLRYDKVDRGTWLVSRSQTAFTVKAVGLRETSTWQCYVSAEFNEKLQGMCNYLHLLSVPRICERPATKITLLPTCTSGLCFFSRSRAPLMSQNTHLSLRPIQTIYLCQSMTGTCLIKISDVLTLCRSNFKILSGALQCGIDMQHTVHTVLASIAILDTLTVYALVQVTFQPLLRKWTVYKALYYLYKTVCRQSISGHTCNNTSLLIYIYIYTEKAGKGWSCSVC